MYKMQRKFIFFFWLFPFYLFSQNNFQSSEYIKTMKETMNIKLDIDNDIQTFEYHTEDLSYNISPNLNSRTNLSFNYRFISFKIGYSPRFLMPDNKSEKGKTKIFKFQGDFFYNNWMQTLEFSKIKGYYVSDIIQNDVTFFDTDFFILPNLNTVNVFGKTLYKFNPDLSLKSIFKQTEIQKKSAGSLLSSLSYGYLDIRDKTSIQDLNTFSLILNAGYIYDFILSKRWYAFMGFMPGAGLEFNKVTTKIDDERDISRNTDFVINLYTQMGIGYNSESFYAGTDFRGIYTPRENNAIIKFNTARNIFRIYVGYRFKAPRFLKKSVDWLEDQNPF